MNNEISLIFSDRWIDSLEFEKCLDGIPDLLSLNKLNLIKVVIPENSKIMIDAGILMLSYLNQLSSHGISISLNFLEGEEGTYGYLNRVGFFDYLSDEIDVLPYRPNVSRANIFRGSNRGMLEIVKIDPTNRDDEIPTILTDILIENVHTSIDTEKFGTATFTVFSELIDNIYNHSKTKLSGFAAMQVYKSGNDVKVIVSDSGDGLISTLRPSISTHYPKYSDFSDSEIIIKVFSEGLSKDGVEMGCGLKVCALHTLKFNAKLTVRLPRSCFYLSPLNGRYSIAKATCIDSRPQILGTHIIFDFALDKSY